VNPDLLAATVTYILPKKDEFAQEFYAQLMTRSPEAYQLFLARRTNMSQLKAALMATLVAVVSGIKNDPVTTLAQVRALGERHRAYGVPSTLYPVVADVLLDTLQAFLKEAWTPNTEHSWREALQIIQGNMLLAYPAEEQ
jgi:hemoglobin-like flavoprotein